jgi:hypothetical protein
MSDDDHCEEQEMEAEALTAIFDECMEIRSSTQPFEWAITLWPEQHQDGDSTNEIENHVGIKVKAIIPLSYPDESSPPQLSIDVVKGLTTEHATELLTLANEVATENAGMPVLYAICERLKEWLLENNVKGMDDLSMYAQMVKREKEKEREGVCILFQVFHDPKKHKRSRCCCWWMFDVVRCCWCWTLGLYVCTCLVQIQYIYICICICIYMRESKTATIWTIGYTPPPELLSQWVDDRCHCNSTVPMTKTKILPDESRIQ